MEFVRHRKGEFVSKYNDAAHFQRVPWLKMAAGYMQSADSKCSIAISHYGLLLVGGSIKKKNPINPFFPYHKIIFFLC